MDGTTSDKTTIDNYVLNHIGTSCASDMARAHGFDMLGNYRTILVCGEKEAETHADYARSTARETALRKLAEQALEQSCVFVSDLQLSVDGNQGNHFTFYGTGYIKN